MSTVTRVREPELDAEQEVDLGRYGRRLASLWWLPLAGLVAGAVIGYLLSLGGQQVWQASTVVYLGTPYSSSGNVGLQSPQTNPSTVKAIVTSEAALEQAAKAAGMQVSQLRGQVATATLSAGTGATATAARSGGTPLVRLTVQGPTRRKTTIAANALGRAVVENPAVAGYADTKIKNLQAQIATDDKAIALIERQLSAGKLSTVEQLLVQLRLTQFQQDRQSQSGFLSQAQLVEKPRVLTRAAAVKTTARSRRNSVVVGGLLGLLLGIAAALAWEPLAARRRVR